MRAPCDHQTRDHTFADADQQVNPPIAAATADSETGAVPEREFDDERHRRRGDGRSPATPATAAPERDLTNLIPRRNTHPTTVATIAMLSTLAPSAVRPPSAKSKAWTTKTTVTTSIPTTGHQHCRQSTAPEGAHWFPGHREVDHLGREDEYRCETRPPSGHPGSARDFDSQCQDHG